MVGMKTLLVAVVALALCADQATAAMRFSWPSNNWLKPQTRNQNKPEGTKGTGNNRQQEPEPEQDDRCGNRDGEVYIDCAELAAERQCNWMPAEPQCGVKPDKERLECVDGCRCQPGFARNQDGTCVPRRECPGAEGQTEEQQENRPRPPFMGGRPGGRPGNMGGRPRPRPGQRPKPEEDDECQGLRNQMYVDCEMAPCNLAPNELMCSEVPARPANGEQPEERPRPEMVPCVVGCRCRPGHARDENNECVPFRMCHQDATDGETQTRPDRPDQTGRPSGNRPSGRIPGNRPGFGGFGNNRPGRGPGSNTQGGGRGFGGRLGRK